MLMWHNAWMARHGREIAAEMRQIGAAVSEGAKPLTALAIVVGLAVLREGSEVVLFLYGIAASGTSGTALLVGGLLGIAAGAAFTGFTYFGLLAIPTRYIFSVTSWLIALLAAGMAAQAVQFLNNAGLLVVLGRTMWDTSWLLSEGSIFGRLLHTLIGYTERPTELQLVVLYRHAGGDVCAHAHRAPCAARARGGGLGRLAAAPKGASAPSSAQCGEGDVRHAVDQLEQRARRAARLRLPCSQLRTVSIGTSIFSAKAACVSPQRARTWRTNAPDRCDRASVHDRRAGFRRSARRPSAAPASWPASSLMASA